MSRTGPCLLMAHRRIFTTMLAALVLLLLVLLLAGCSAPVISAPARTTDTAAHNIWNGRMGLLIDAPDNPAGGYGEQSFSASFELQGTPQQGSLSLFSPLGAKVAQLEWQPGTAWLSQGEQIFESSSLQELVQRSLGTDVPVEALFQWLQGRATPVAGWHVNLSQYAQGRITAERHTPLPHAKLRLVLEHVE